MKRLYLSAEDPVIGPLTEWLAQRLERDALQVTDESLADVAVLSTESADFETRCKALSKAGCTVFVLTPENKGALAQRIIRASGKMITFRQPEDAVGVLQRLMEVLISPPVPGKKEVVAIYSAKQAGGSFIAWNLWALLGQQGKKVSLCSLEDEASPFRAWIPEEKVFFGTGEGDWEADIWIVDASGGRALVSETDLSLVVVDSDPAKVAPDVAGAMRITNRVWPDADTPFPYVPDLGQLGVQSMHQHTAAVLLNVNVAALFEGLWRYWHGEPLDHLGTSKEEEGAATDQEVLTEKKRCGHDDCVAEFCLHDGESVPDPNAFQFDDDADKGPVLSSGNEQLGHSGGGVGSANSDEFQFDEE